MGAPMPPVLVMIVCKVILGAPDDNSAYTHWRASEWDMTGGVMHCRRQEVPLYDPAVDQGAQEQPFNQMACNRTAMRLGPQFDIDHKDKPWRFWRAACPAPIVDTQSGKIVGWKLPECSTYGGTIICDQDTEI
jgi:hypothetical protein